MCSAFRNEGVAGVQSSELIRQAVAVTRSVYGEPPQYGMVTFVDRKKTRPKSRDHIGRCYQAAGFRLLEQRTKGGLYVCQMVPEDMPEAMEPYNAQLTLFNH